MSNEVPRQFKPNLVLVNRRKAVGWESRKRAARELHRVGQQRGIRETPTVEAIEKAMYRHETGRVAVTDPIYRQLYCLAYDAKPHDLFGELTGSAEDRPHFTARSHKFVTAFVGAEGTARLRESAGCTPAVGQWHTCYSTPVEHPEGDCTLYVWPCGSAIFHLVEHVQLSTIAALAAWREVSYGDNIKWAIDYLAPIAPAEDESAVYVLGAQWVVESAWPAELLETALRIMSTPKVLLHRGRAMDDEHLAHAELIEQSLLSETYDHVGIESFGVRGISAGYASWSGLVYHPISAERSLTEAELIACELAIQSMWAYSDAIARQVEQGRDPQVPPEHGWRYLRGVRSRLTVSRLRETGQHQAMRRAILRTCDLMPALDQSIETLRDTERG
ncbi:hypothetical protein K7640_13595 [Micromonospora sp. PLK6-60]|uniref:hypothetical protein n=1 Tax=Micromonospora sp. PLK6-60 TaxID=2873383 RepID=UPI001CA6A961|nr:hypothetical protein [Micromonospora sp. PLK6-60]MBY8872870.1 hypothetical protein [Micromonospora sp. PLK6-60]